MSDVRIIGVYGDVTSAGDFAAKRVESTRVVIFEGFRGEVSVVRKSGESDGWRDSDAQTKTSELPAPRWGGTSLVIATRTS